MQSLHIVYYYTNHNYSEAKDFISSCLSCSVWRIVSQSKDLQLGSHVTNSQKSIQSLTDFNPTKFYLIRILSFVRFQPKLSSYICGWCGRKGVIFSASFLTLIGNWHIPYLVYVMGSIIPLFFDWNYQNCWNMHFSQKNIKIKIATNLNLAFQKFFHKL